MAIFDEAKKVLELFAFDLQNDLISALKQYGHTGIGGQSGIAGSMSFKVFNQSQTLFFEFYLDDYYKYTDKGTKGAKTKGSGGEKMQKAIKDWMVRKGISTQALTIYKSKLKNPSKSKVDFKKAESALAWAIKKQINKKGIIKRFGYSGSGWFTKTLNDGRLRTLEEQLSQVFEREITVNILAL